MLAKIKRKQKAERDILFFVNYYFAEYTDCQHAPYQIKDYRDFQARLNTRVRDVSAEPRDHAKTTRAMIKKAYCICFRKKHYIVTISDSATQSIQDNMNLRHELQDNERILEDFGDVIGEASEKDTQADFITRDGIRVAAVGSGTKIRGRRHRKYRPDLIFIDDLENDENIYSEEYRNKLYKWVHSSVLPMLDKKLGDFYMHGTVLHKLSVLNRFLEEDAKQHWTRKRLSAESPDGKILWPGKFTRSMLDAERLDLGDFAYRRELLNDPVSDTDVVFKSIWFPRYTFNFQDEKTQSLVYDVVMAVDPVRKKTEAQDYFAISVMATLINDEQRRYVLECEKKRITLHMATKKMLHFCSVYAPRLVVIESNAFQLLFKDDFEEEVARLKLDIKVVGVENTRDNKYARILRLQAPAEQGRIWLPEKAPWLQPIMDEIEFYPQVEHDDGLDCVEMAYRYVRPHIPALDQR